MADQDDSQPAVPDSTDWSEWTFAQALRAVTGDEVDLRPLSTAGWFLFNPAGVNQPGGTDEVGYQAFGIQFYGAGINHAAIDAFEAAADRLDTITAELIEGRRGAADVYTLSRLHEAVLDLEAFLDTSGAEFRRRAGQVEAGGTEVAGTAAGFMHETMDSYADLLELWTDRLNLSPTLPLSTAVRHARDDLHTFSVETASAWQAEREAGIRTRIRDAVAAETDAIRRHLISQGVVIGTPEYTFDQWDPTKNPGPIITPADLDAFTTRTRAAADAAVASYPRGDLRLAETWTRINQAITATVAGSLDNLDRTARTFLQPLRDSYLILTPGLKPLGQDSNPADAGSSVQTDAPPVDTAPGDTPPSGEPTGTPQPLLVVGALPPGVGLLPDPSGGGFPTGSTNAAPSALERTDPPETLVGPDGLPLPQTNGLPEGQPGQSPGSDGEGLFAGDGQPSGAGDGRPAPAGGAALTAMLTGPAAVAGGQDQSDESPAAQEASTDPVTPLADGSPVGSVETLAVTDPAVPAGEQSGGPAAIALTSTGGGRGRNRAETERRPATVPAMEGDDGPAVSPSADGSVTEPPGLPGDSSAVGDPGGTAHPDRADSAGGPGPSALQVPGHVVAGGHGLPSSPDGAGPGSGGLEPPSSRGAEFGLSGWDGRIGGDGAAGLTRLAADGPAPVAQISYRGSGFWPTGQYGSLPTQLAGSPVSVGGGVGMPFLPGMGGWGGGSDRGRERRTWLTEDEAVWGAAPTARAGVVGPLEVDEYLDSDQLVAPGEPQPQTEDAVHVVAGRGDDEDEFEYPGHGGQLP